MKKITVILADDHAILRYGISTFLSRTDDIEVVGEASTGDGCIELFKKEKPDLSIIDIEMPGKNGIQVVEAIRQVDPDAKILILSMHSHKPMLQKALKADIDGYLSKNSTKEKILQAVRTIADGKKVFSDTVSKMADEKDAAKKSDKNHILTKREKEILKLVVEGHSSPEIADKLYISRRTVDTHRNNLMQKLDIHNTASLVRFALKNNLVDDL